MTWHKTRLGNVVTLKRGHDLPESQRRTGEVPVVSSSGITGSHDEPKAKAPGVVTGRYGTLGEVFYVDRDFWPLNTALYVADFKGNNPRFVSYLLRNVLRNHRSDKAAVPGVNRNVLHELIVQSTDEESQERVASFLSVYDDQAEINRRRIRLLEEATSEVYREWFVRRRFPGREHAVTQDGMPEGWETKPLGCCVSFRSGKTPSKKRSDYWDGETPWVSSGEMKETRLYDTSLHISDKAVEDGATLVPAGTPLVVVRGMSLAKECRISVVTRPMTFNQDVKALICNPGIEPGYLGHALLEMRDYIRDLATDASHGTKKLDTPVLERLPILIPEHRLQRRFAEIAGSFDELRDNLHAQTALLRETAALLLPRVMAGELAV